MAGHDRNIDSIPCHQSASQPIRAAIDGPRIHIRKAAMAFDDRRVHVSRRRGMNVGCQEEEAEFTTTPAFDPSELRVHVIENPFGARDELSSPTVVRWVPPFVLSNNTTPGWRSISCSRRLKVDWRMFRVSFACLRLRCCDVTTAKRRSLSPTSTRLTSAAWTGHLSQTLPAAASPFVIDSTQTNVSRA